MSPWSPPCLHIHPPFCYCRYRVIKLDISSPTLDRAALIDVIPQHSKDLLQGCTLLQGGVMVVQYLADVQVGGCGHTH
jgi:hypothetical protein